MTRSMKRVCLGGGGRSGGMRGKQQNCMSDDTGDWWCVGCMPYMLAGGCAHYKQRRLVCARLGAPLVADERRSIVLAPSCS